MNHILTLDLITPEVMTKQSVLIEQIKKDWDNLHYPSAKKWMWNYCYFLGKFTDSEGRNFDLGIHIYKNFPINSTDRFLEANVNGNEAGDYYSGDFRISHYISGGYDYPQRKKEALKRAFLLGIVPESFLSLHKIDKEILGL
jgi:hypothetical protein